MAWLAWRAGDLMDYVSDLPLSRRKNKTRTQIVAMTIDLQNTTQKKSKKDRKTSDDRKRKERPSDVSGNDDLVLDREERKRKRKEKRREKEGAIDGALSFPMYFAEG
jgi:hypothetical protein